MSGGTALTSAELIRAVGEALWGSGRWRSEMATALGVGDRPLRRWAAGEADPPAGVWRDLHAIAVERSADLTQLIPHLEDRSADK